jgi:hypothetical protein
MVNLNYRYLMMVQLWQLGGTHTLGGFSSGQVAIGVELEMILHLVEI